MKEDLITIVRILGIGLNEVMIDIKLSFFEVNSIEFRYPNEIILHHFKINTDYELDWDTLDYKSQKYIWQILSTLMWN